MKAYKITENKNNVVKAGKIFVPVENQIVLLATPTEPQMFYDKWTFNKFKDSGSLLEVELEDERWIHPHLYKPIKDILKVK